MPSQITPILIHKMAFQQFWLNLSIPWTMIKCKIKPCEGADYELSFVQLLLVPPINLMQSIQGKLRQNEI